MPRCTSPPRPGFPGPSHLGRPASSSNHRPPACSTSPVPPPHSLLPSGSPLPLSRALARVVVLPRRAACADTKQLSKLVNLWTVHATTGGHHCYWSSQQQ
ncbi:hypothetical protein PVAP13_6NG089100 [Panicum virgatum]|uniref:Uncharacterized protein n=1 Tax=Panicum virgatum TaxID=38727 RepID=A0A8T0QVU9_PANVG|nr:hypothetical protein PVAP13_6NG089100 [Panicum virgatum]